MKDEPTMLTSKIGTVIAVSAVSVAVAPSGVASAASVTRQPGTTTAVATAPPTAAAPMVEYTILVGVLAVLGQIVPGASG